MKFTFLRIGEDLTSYPARDYSMPNCCFSVLQAKYEATLIENNKLLEVTKDLELKIRNLQEKQTEILKQSLVN